MAMHATMIKLIAAGVLIAVAIGVQYVGAAMGDHTATAASSAPSVSPEDVTRAAGPLPVTVIENYF